MNKTSTTYNNQQDPRMSVVRATYSLEAMAAFQYPPPPYIQNPGTTISPSQPPTYVPGSPACPPSYPVLNRQNLSELQCSWPYQPWGGNIPSMSPAYQSAPYSYYNPQYNPALHHMTHPQMPQYIPPTPYNIMHPQFMPQAPQYFPPTHPMTHPQTRPQAPQYFPPTHPMTHPQTRPPPPQYTSPYPYPRSPHPQAITQRPQFMPSTPYSMTHPQTIPNNKACSVETNGKNCWNMDKSFIIKSTTSQCSENSSGEASESNTSEDEIFEEENNKLKELNEENSKENANEEGSESDCLKVSKDEEKNIKNTEKVTETQGPNKLNEKKCPSENHGTKSESPLKTELTPVKTSKKKKKKGKNKSGVKDEDCVSDKVSSTSKTSQDLENNKENQKSKDEDFLAQFGAVITEVHCTMAKLRTQSGKEYYFSPALCFLYGVCLAHLELWHVLIEGQHVKVTLNLTIPENPRLIRVTVEDENPAHDPDDTVLDLQQWCSINSVPKEATLTLIQQVKGFH